MLHLRHFLLGLFLPHILTQKAWTHARSQLQQQTHQLCWRAPLRLPVPPLVQINQPSSWSMCHRHHQQCTVYIEMEFVVNALPVKLIGMNLTMMLMCDYIKFCADRLLISLGCQRHYKIATRLNGWKWSASKEKKILWKTCWRILKIWNKCRQSWLNFSPQRKLLTPLPHIHTSSPPYVYVSQYFFPSSNTSCPPHPHTFCFRGFTETWMFSKVQRVFCSYFWWIACLPLQMVAETASIIHCGHHKHTNRLITY